MSLRHRYELDAPPVRRLLDEAAEMAERMHRDYVRLAHVLNHELHRHHLRFAADDWTTDPCSLDE